MNADQYLSYADLAKALEMPRSTLVRKLSAYNRLAKKEDLPAVLPDKKEDHGHYFKFRFASNRLTEIKNALDKVTLRRRGRPITKKRKDTKTL